jgi:hypothetical protein
MYKRLALVRWRTRRAARVLLSIMRALKIAAKANGRDTVPAIESL